MIYYKNWRAYNIAENIVQTLLEASLLRHDNVSIKEAQRIIRSKLEENGV